MFEYNQANLVTSIKYPSGVNNYFYYDSMLRRYALEDSDGLRYFSWDYSGLKLLTERDKEGDITALYSHGYSSIPGIGSVATAQKFESDTVYYQFPSCDHRGSVYRLTDIDGDVVFSAEYNAFGEILDKSNTGASNRLEYQSNWLTLKDSNGELVLSPARVYSAKFGRFLQKDMLFQMTLLHQRGSYWNSIFKSLTNSISLIDNYGIYRSFNNNPYSYADFLGQWDIKIVSGRVIVESEDGDTLKELGDIFGTEGIFSQLKSSIAPGTKIDLSGEKPIIGHIKRPEYLKGIVPEDLQKILKRERKRIKNRTQVLEKRLLANKCGQ